MEAKRQMGHRPNKPSYKDIPLITPGNPVRVKVSESWRRATIDCVDQAAGTVDVTFTCPVASANQAEMEATLPVSVVRPLEAFEVRPEDERRRAFEDDLHGAAAAAKENANAIFKLGDMEAAIEYYGQIIEELRRLRTPQPGIERRALLTQDGALVLGIVHEVDPASQKATISVTAPSKKGTPPTQTVQWRTLIPIHCEHLTLQSSLYMNRARGLMQVGRQQEAAQDLSVVIGLRTRGRAAAEAPPRQGFLSAVVGLWSHSRGAAETPPGPVTNENREQLTKAYYLRAKTRLSRMRIEPARADAKEAWALEPPDATAKLLRQLDREIEAAQKEKIRSNKKIAKEIAKFADSAFQNLDTAQLGGLEHAAEPSS